MTDKQLFEKVSSVFTAFPKKNRIFLSKAGDHFFDKPEKVETIEVTRDDFEKLNPENFVLAAVPETPAETPETPAETPEAPEAPAGEITEPEPGEDVKTDAKGKGGKKR